MLSHLKMTNTRNDCAANSLGSVGIGQAAAADAFAAVAFAFAAAFAAAAAASASVSTAFAVAVETCDSCPRISHTATACDHFAEMENKYFAL